MHLALPTAAARHLPLPLPLRRLVRSGGALSRSGVREGLRDLAALYARLPVTRRAALVTLAAFIGGCALYARIDLTVHGVPLWLLTGTFYAVIVGPIALGTLMFFPALAQLTEAVAASRLCVASFTCAFPALGLPLLSQPLVMTTIVLGGAAILRFALARLCREAGRQGFDAAQARRGND